MNRPSLGTIQPVSRRNEGLVCSGDVIQEAGAFYSGAAVVLHGGTVRTGLYFGPVKLPWLSGKFPGRLSAC